MPIVYALHQITGLRMNDNDDLIPNVTTEQGLRQCLEQDGLIEVECREEASRRGPAWHGLWTMTSIHPSRTAKRLVTARAKVSDGGVKVREFKTATGVISFLVGCGLPEARFPLKAGQKTTLQLQS